MPPDPSITDFFVQAAASLLGALAGAMAAFELERQRQKRAERRHRIGRVRHALFSLVAERSFLLNLTNQHLEPLRTNPDRDLALRPVPPIAPNVAIDIDGLGFMLDGQDGDILNQLTNADLRFRTAVAWLTLRNELHQRFQDRLEVFQRQAQPDATFDDLRGFIGRGMNLQLRSVTDALYEMTDFAVSGNREAESKLREYGGRAFPKDKLFKIVEMPPAGSSGPHQT